jgi:hypothetical protein
MYCVGEEDEEDLEYEEVQQYVVDDDEEDSIVSSTQLEILRQVLRDEQSLNNAPILSTSGLNLAVASPNSSLRSPAAAIPIPPARLLYEAIASNAARLGVVSTSSASVSNSSIDVINGEVDMRGLKRKLVCDEGDEQLTNDGGQQINESEEAEAEFDSVAHSFAAGLVG